MKVTNEKLIKNAQMNEEKIEKQNTELKVWLLS
jgi:hypothetical protein